MHFGFMNIILLLHSNYRHLQGGKYKITNTFIERQDHSAVKIIQFWLKFNYLFNFLNISTCSISNNVLTQTIYVCVCIYIYIYIYIYKNI